MIDPQALKDAGIDYDAGLERFMNDSVLYEAVLRAFVGENILQRAAKAYADGDMDRLYKTAHEAKGSGGNAGLDMVYERASVLSALLRGGDYTREELDKCFKSFCRVYAATEAGITAALSD